MGIQKRDSKDIAARLQKFAEKHNETDNPDFQKLLSDILSFYPPTIPTRATRDYSPKPITISSSIEDRLLVEFFAKSFQQEAALMFEKPNINLQYSAFRYSKTFEAYLAQTQDFRLDIKNVQDVQTREGISGWVLCVGCCFFYQDPMLTELQKVISPWVASFAWVHPFYRKTGALKNIFHTANDKYGAYWIEGPLSSEMEAYVEKNKIDPVRILSSDRERG